MYNTGMIADACIPDCAWAYCAMFDEVEYKCLVKCSDMHYLAFCMYLDGASHM